MSIDVEAVGKQMIAAAQGVVGGQWPSVQKYFEAESKMFAQRLASIGEMYADKHISEERAKDHVEFQKEAYETALLAVAGMTQLTIEQALNAAIKVVRDVVNKGIGFALLA